MRQALGAVGAFVIGAALAVVALAPAGTSDEDAPELAAVELGAGVVPPSVNEPTWAVGDAWRVEFNERLECWLVVVSAEEESYRQGVSCADEPTTRALAVEVAAVEYRYLGDFSTDSLDGLGDGERVRFFEWPLTHGNTWGTTWYGENADVVARFDPTLERYVMTMSLDGEDLLTYDYDPRLRWWSQLEFAGGWKLEVHERATGWSAAASYGQAEDRFTLVRTTLDMLPSGGFSVPASDDYLFATITRAGVFAHRFTLRDPQGNAAWESTSTSNTNIGLPASSCGGAFCAQIIPAAEGEWAIEDGHASLGQVRYRVRGVALSEFAGAP